MPKGDMIYRPATVEVEVLPPVDTSAWSADTIDEHVASVRNMYLQALGQEPSEGSVKPLRIVRK
jgi:putative phosphoserine phosphatase/1-acylglycerol-3-phosphate O-acyltransferase